MAKEKRQEPQFYTSPINSKVLNYNVYIMKSSEKLMYTMMTFGAGGLVGLVFYGGLFKQDGVTTLATLISNLVVFILFGMIAAKVFIPVIAESLRKKRLSKLSLQFRDFLISLSNSMSSGMNVNDSLGNAYRDLMAQYSEDAYIVQETGEIIGCIQNNIAVEDALRFLGERSGIEDITNFSIVFSTCYRTGGNLKQIVRRSTDIISEKLEINAEIETKITSNKLQMIIMNVIPIVLMLLIRVTSPDMAAGFATIIGVIAITVSAGIFIGAYVWGRKIMDIKG